MSDECNCFHCKIWRTKYTGAGERAHALRLKLFEMRDAREVTSAAGFTLTTEAKAKLYDIQQDIIRAAIAKDDAAIDRHGPARGGTAGRLAGGLVAPLAPVCADCDSFILDDGKCCNCGKVSE